MLDTEFHVFLECAPLQQSTVTLANTLGNFDACNKTIYIIFIDDGLSFKNIKHTIIVALLVG